MKVGGAGGTTHFRLSNIVQIKQNKNKFFTLQGVESAHKATPARLLQVVTRQVSRQAEVRLQSQLFQAELHPAKALNKLAQGKHAAKRVFGQRCSPFGKNCPVVTICMLHC